LLILPKLCVNVDHVATIRQARKTFEPDPIRAAILAELAGASGITVHLREDRRHIQDRDVRLLREVVQTKLNLEMAFTDEMIEIAKTIKPDQATIVPERRQELTTEGGLDVIQNRSIVKDAIKKLQDQGIQVSIFIDPDIQQIEVVAELGPTFIELHTGTYSEAKNETQRKHELGKLYSAAKFAQDVGLRVHAGHGLNYQNVIQVAAIPGIEDLNIGHSIVSRAVFVGFEEAVREMINLIECA
jgi:pyridoxine 5-phosphate synthase